MTSMHNLDEGVTESFEFVLGGNTYQMRYPTTEEIMAIAKETDQNKQTESVLKFIKALDEKAPTIDKALANINLKVRQKFNKMISSEFMDSE